MKKDHKDPVLGAIAKSLLNNLIGRLGLDITKPVTKIVDAAKFNELSKTKSITDFIGIVDMYLVSYSSKVYKKLKLVIN